MSECSCCREIASSTIAWLTKQWWCRFAVKFYLYCMRIWFLILTLLYVLQVQAQPFTVQIEGARKLNELELGQMNRITVPDLPKGVTVKMAKGIKDSINEKEFIVTNDHCDLPFDTLVFYKGGKVFYKKPLRLEHYGAPVFSIGERTCLDTMKAKYINDNELSIFPITSGYEIRSFNIVIAPRMGETIGPIPSDGGKYSKRQLWSLKMLKYGDVIYFQDIIVTSPKGDTAKMYRKDFSIRITKDLKPTVTR